jgi:hypothetical protein
MDHNEHTYDGPLGRALLDPEGVGLQEAVLRHTGKKTGATFFRGSKPINGLWVTSDIEIANACVMPFGYGIGDHQMFIIDVTMESLVGKNPTKVVRPASRWLNSKMPRCGRAYVKSLERNIVQHRLLEWLNEVHRSSLSYKKEDGYVKRHQQGGVRLYDTRKKDVQEDKVLPHPLFSRSVYLDPEGASILLNHPMA